MFTIEGVQKLHGWTHASLTIVLDHLQVAQRELADTRDNVARSRKVAASHATSVMGERVADIIVQWTRANEEVDRLRTILQSLILVIGPDGLTDFSKFMPVAVAAAGLPFGDTRDWEHLQKKVGEALCWRFESADSGLEIAKARAYWAAFADAVLADPAADPAPLPSREDLKT